MVRLDANRSGAGSLDGEFLEGFYDAWMTEHDPLLDQVVENRVEGRIPFGLLF